MKEKRLSSLFTDRQEREWKNWVIPPKSVAQLEAELRSKFSTTTGILQIYI